MSEPDGSRAGAGTDPARRDRRAASFGAELATAWRAELACLWERPDADAQVPGATAFKARVEALTKLAAKPGVDAEAIQALAKGLYGAAAALRTDPHVRRWAMGTAIRGEAGARDYRQPPTPGQRPAAAPAAAAPPATGIAVVREVVAEVGPRLAALRVALAADPTREPGWDQLPGELKLQVPGLAVALASQPAAAQAARQALAHLAAAEQALAAPGGATPERLRGLVMPLNQVHVVFRDLPALARLFPPPRTRALPVAPPAARRPTGPVAPPSRTVTGPVSAVPRPAGPLPGAIAPPGPKKPMAAPTPMGADVHVAADGSNRTSTGSLRLPGAADRPAPAPVPEPEPQPEVEVEAATPADPASPAEVSKRRMAAIASYLKDPDADPLLREPAVIYRLVADEHAYQQDQVAHLGMLLSLMPETADPARRQALTGERAACTKRQRQLFELLKRITARGRPP